MSNVAVIEKTGEIDGKPIKWSVLAISGTLDGQPYTLEIKANKIVTKNDLIFAKILLGNSITSNANNAEVDNFLDNFPQ